MKSVLNISAYLFVALDDLPALRGHIEREARSLGLLGTVLLAEEGINLFLAGVPADIRGFIDALKRHRPGLAGLQPKESFSGAVPFQRLKVKVKREIIRMNHPAIRPGQGRASAVGAATLARWLSQGVDDAGRAVVLLDTRNAFEVDAGRFKGAIDWRIGKFTEFPEAVLRHRETLRGKTVVSYCTGGIRCEKAALFMAEAGIDSVWQLEGGILKYFEEVGARHFEGDCFVFDERGVVDSALLPASASVKTP